MIKSYSNNGIETENGVFIEKDQEVSLDDPVKGGLHCTQRNKKKQVCFLLTLLCVPT